MADLETIVRPFQSPDNAPGPQPYVTPNQQSNPPLFLSFGKGGSGRTFSGSYSSRTTFYLEQQVVELSE